MDKEKMGKSKIIPLLIELSVPAMIGMLVNAIYNIVDRMFIGNAPQLGSVGLAGITISYPITLLSLAVGLMAGVGGSTRFSIALGAKEYDEARIYQGNSITLTFVFGVSLMIIGNLFMNPILSFLGASDAVLPYARSYLSIILFGAPFQCISLCGNSFSRAQGNSKNAMISQMLGAIFNIIFDYIFIFQLHMGMEGAALATIGGQFLSMIWQLSFLFSNRGMIKAKIPDLKLKAKYALTIVQTGMPAFLMQISNSFLNIVLNSRLAIYGGDIAISTVGIISSVQTLMQMPLSGISQGQQPIVSFNLGAKLYHRCKETLKYTVIASTAIACLGFTCIQLFPEFIITCFNSEIEIIELGKNVIRIWFICLPLLGCQMMCAQFFQAIGQIKKSSFLNLLRQCILLIPSVYLLSSIFGLYGIFVAVPLSDLLAFLITMYLIKKELKAFEK